MQIGPLPRSSRRSHGIEVFQLLRIVIVIWLAAAGALALSLSVEDQSSSLEAVAAVDRQLERTSAAQPANEPDHTASLQVATADPFSPDPTFANAATPVVPDEPAQEDSPASITRDASADHAAPVPADPSGDARSHETEQASTHEPSSPATSETTDAVNVASIATDPVQEADIVDLNTASVDELNRLRNAGSLGRAIVKGRPYAAVEDLVKRKVLRRSVYEKIKDQVTVR